MLIMVNWEHWRQGHPAFFAVALLVGEKPVTQCMLYQNNYNLNHNSNWTSNQ